MPLCNLNMAHLAYLTTVQYKIDKWLEKNATLLNLQYFVLENANWLYLEGFLIFTFFAFLRVCCRYKKNFAHLFIGV